MSAFLGTSRRRMPVAVAAALSVCLVGATIASAARSTTASTSLSATIALSDATRASLTTTGAVSAQPVFAVTRSYAYDRETIWVTNTCWDAAGAVVVDTDAPVLWGTSTSLVGTTWPMTIGGTRCRAYVTLRPWQDRPLGSAVIDYTVV